MVGINYGNLRWYNPVNSVGLVYAQQNLGWTAQIEPQSAQDEGPFNIANVIAGWLRLAFAFVSLSGLFLLGQSSPQTPAPPNGTPENAPEVADPPSPPPDDSTEAMFPHFKDTRFWLSGQANFIFQTHPEFHAPYSGPHSLGPHYEKATSRVLTMFGGIRFNNSTEFVGALEEAGGSALSLGFGLAGNTDLDIVRNPLLSKAPYLAAVCSTKCSRSATTRSRTSATTCLFSTNCHAAASNCASVSSACPTSSMSTPSAPTPDSSSTTGPSTTMALGTMPPTRAATPSDSPPTSRTETGDSVSAKALMPKVANGIDLVWKPWQAHAENFEYELRHDSCRKNRASSRFARFYQLRQHGHLS